jgi:hypothetical protein
LPSQDHSAAGAQIQPAPAAAGTKERDDVEVNIWDLYQEWQDQQEPCVSIPANKQQREKQPQQRQQQCLELQTEQTKQQDQQQKRVKAQQQVMPEASSGQDQPLLSQELESLPQRQPGEVGPRQHEGQEQLKSGQEKQQQQVHALLIQGEGGHEQKEEGERVLGKQQLWQRRHLAGKRKEGEGMEEEGFVAHHQQETRTAGKDEYEGTECSEGGVGQLLCEQQEQQSKGRVGRVQLTASGKQLEQATSISGQKYGRRERRHLRRVVRPQGWLRLADKGYLTSNGSDPELEVMHEQQEEGGAEQQEQEKAREECDGQQQEEEEQQQKGKEQQHEEAGEESEGQQQEEEQQQKGKEQQHEEAGEESEGQQQEEAGEESEGQQQEGEEQQLQEQEAAVHEYEGQQQKGEEQRQQQEQQEQEGKQQQEQQQKNCEEREQQEAAIGQLGQQQREEEELREESTHGQLPQQQQQQEEQPDQYREATERPYQQRQQEEGKEPREDSQQWEVEILELDQQQRGQLQELSGLATGPSGAALPCLQTDGIAEKPLLKAEECLAITAASNVAEAAAASSVEGAAAATPSMARVAAPAAAPGADANAADISAGSSRPIHVNCNAAASTHVPRQPTASGSGDQLAPVAASGPSGGQVRGCLAVPRMTRAEQRLGPHPATIPWHQRVYEHVSLTQRLREKGVGAWWRDCQLGEQSSAR